MDLQLDGKVALVTGSSQLVGWTEAWRQLGATHLSLNTMGAGLTSPAEHIRAIRRYKEAVTG